jgi:hypothetical protein
MSEQITITRRSIVGFGYTSACENDERGNLRVCETTSPNYTGTIKQVAEEIEQSRTLRSYDSGGTYYSTGWFVKVSGKWRKINASQSRTSQYLPLDLLGEAHPEDDRKYYLDAVTVELI